MGGDQAQLDARHLPEKNAPDKKPEIPAHQKKLENRQAHIANHVPASESFRAFDGRCRVPGGGIECHVLAPDDQYADAIHEAISSTSASTELRNRKAEAMAAWKRVMALSGINSRSRNCFTTRRVRRWTTSSAAINRGTATGNGRELPRRAGKARPHSRQQMSFQAESTRSGSQANSEMTMMRWRTSSSASSDRCARSKSWNSGPPRTSEKSCGALRRLSPDRKRTRFHLKCLRKGAKLVSSGGSDEQAW